MISLREPQTEGAIIAMRSECRNWVLLTMKDPVTGLCISQTYNARGLYELCENIRSLACDCALHHDTPAPWPGSFLIEQAGNSVTSDDAP